MEAIGQLAGGIAHDFNNILGGITSYADILIRELEQNTELNDIARRIADSAMKAASLTM